jgi:hypothetical protein
MSPGHQPGRHQSAEAVLFGNGMEDHDEGGGRPGDTEPGTAGQRDQQAGDNRGIQPILRRDAAANRQSHGQRHRDDADRDRRQQIGPQFAQAIAATQLVAQRGGKGRYSGCCRSGFTQGLCF